MSLLRSLTILLCLQATAAWPAGRVKVGISSGYQTSPFRLTLESSEPQTEIRFTTDATEPTAASSRLYQGPFEVTNTTILRAALFNNGKRLSPVESRSYLFLDDVIHQPARPAGYSAERSAWNGTATDFEMDPRIVESPIYRDRMQPALRALPVVSVVCEPSDLFGRRGLYLNTLERGTNWERTCSVELILTNGESAFRVGCGLRIQGNYNRIPEKTPKHSFRLTFKNEYGPGKLHYRLFPDSPVDTFDTVVLRGDYNNSWTHWDDANRERGQRTRDAWMKDSHRAMGWIAPHNRYVHLFLNGLYWGIYDFTERPDANFAAANFGGAREDYDVINENEVKEGRADAFNLLERIGTIASPRDYERLQQLLDVTAFADYTLLNFYAGNEDWGDRKNWYAIRSRAGTNTAFRFIVWDGERVLEDPETDTLRRPNVWPLRLRHTLERYAPYRALFAERVKKHCFAGGALTPEAAAKRWMARASEVDLAIVAESARWGDSRRRMPYTRDREWVTEQRRLLREYFPRRTGTLLQQLREEKLFSALIAPDSFPSYANAPLRPIISGPP